MEKRNGGNNGDFTINRRSPFSMWWINLDTQKEKEREREREKVNSRNGNASKEGKCSLYFMSLCGLSADFRSIISFGCFVLALVNTKYGRGLCALNLFSQLIRSVVVWVTCLFLRWILFSYSFFLFLRRKKARRLGLKIFL